MLVIGVLYLHNITNSRVTTSPNVVGPREIVPLPPGVLVVTTHWSNPPTSTSISLEKEFRDQFCEPDAMVRYDGTRASAWAVIRKLQSAGVSVPLETFRMRLQEMYNVLPDKKIQGRRFRARWLAFARMFH